MDGLQQTAGITLPEGFCDPSPFPPVEISQSNSAYAGVLLQVCADGGRSELTAVAQYMNHYLTFRETELSAMAYSIALVEMYHLSVIGQLIKELGGETNRWHGGLVDRSIRDVTLGGTVVQKLRRDILAEENAIISYQMLIAEIGDPKIQAVLARILRDEQLHLELFSSALARWTGARAS